MKYVEFYSKRFNDSAWFGKGWIMFRKQKTVKPRALFVEALEDRTVPVANVFFIPTIPPTLSTGTNPVSVDVGDLNDDGRVDVVVANYNSSNVSVFLGNGDGTYQTPLTFSTGANPSSVFVGDVDGDCKLDIVTSSFSTDSINVLLNTGTNGGNTVSFSSSINSSAGNKITAIAKADFNNDGFIDHIFTANSGNNSVSLLTYTNNGTFGNELSFAVGSKPAALAIADLNGDNYPDVVVANQDSNNFSVLLSLPNGCVYDRQAIYDVGTSPTSIAIGDFNNDSILDVVASNKVTNNVSVLLGKGGGTFNCQTTFAVGTNPSSVAVADFNNDNNLDIATSNKGSDNISVLLGNGNGTFVSQINYNSISSPSFIKLANVNGPCFFLPDIITADFSSNDIRILLNTDANGSGSNGGGSSGGAGAGTSSGTGTGGSGGPFSRINASNIIAVGPGSSPNSFSSPSVRIYNSSSSNPSNPIANIFPYNSLFTGGVVTAIGDINHDGTVDIIVGPGIGGGPNIKVYSGVDFTTVLYNFFAFEPSFSGGVTLASADIDGDFFDDILVGAGPGGGPRIIAFSGKNLSVIKDFFAFEPSFTGGVTIATGLINSDSIFDIIAGAGTGGGPRVKTFDGSNLNVLNDFFAFDPSFLGGVYVSAGNVGGGTFDKIIVGAGSGGGPNVRVFDANANMLQNFFAYASTFTGGVRVAAGLSSPNSTIADIITGPGIGGTSNVRSYNSLGQLTSLNFLAYDQSFVGGIYVAGRGF